LKAAREKCQVTYKGKSIRITDFSTETLKARNAWRKVFQTLKENNCKPRLHYLAELSFIIEGEIKTFHDKQKPKQFMKNIKESNTTKTTKWQESQNSFQY
jgi:hypothetical protein